MLLAVARGKEKRRPTGQKKSGIGLMADSRIRRERETKNNRGKRER